MVKEYLKIEIDDGFDDDRCVLRVKRREREREMKREREKKKKMVTRGA